MGKYGETKNGLPLESKGVDSFVVCSIHL